MPIPTVLPEFQAGQPAHAVNAALQQAVRTMDRAHHCAVLWFAEVLDRSLYRELGYASIHLYAQQELGFSKTRTGDFLRMARRLEDLPHVKRSLANGKLGYTKAREILKVATPATEKEWVRAAAKLPRRKLEQKVKRVRMAGSCARKDAGQPTLLPPPADEQNLAAEVPQRITLKMTPEQFARYEALHEKLAKGGHQGTSVERILQGLEALAECADTRADDKPAPSAGAAPGDPAPAGAAPGGATSEGAVPRGTSFQVFVRQCPDCGQFSVPTSRGELPLARAEGERILCDSRIDDPRRGPNRHSIPPAVRRRVLARDGHRCQAPGCTNTRFLEVHHITPRSRGGSNAASNLITLCAACHRHTHRYGVSLPTNRRGNDQGNRGGAKPSPQGTENMGKGSRQG